MVSFLCGLAVPGGLERSSEGVFDPPNVRLSEHFAVQWGDELSPDPALLDRFVADAEYAHAGAMALGWLPPRSDGRVNLYFGSTGPGTPDIEFEGGYVYLDAQGLPYLTVGPSTLETYADDPSGVRELLTHEFTHILQFHHGITNQGERSLFLWEATANWMVPEVTGDLEGAAIGWGRYLLHPELTVTTSSYDWEDPVRGGRQYDAATFLHHLSANEGLGHALIRDLWDVPTLQDPLDTLHDRILGGVRAPFLRFAVSHALEDHPLAQVYRDSIEVEGTEGGDRRVTRTLRSEGEVGWITGADRPEAFAWNHLVWHAEGEGTVLASVEPTDGSQGSAHGTQAVLVLDRDGVLEPVDADVPIPVLPGDVLHLVVVATPETWEDGERFGYGYVVDFDPARRGCATGGLPASWLGLLALALSRRPRRATPPRPSAGPSPQAPGAARRTRPPSGPG